MGQKSVKRPLKIVGFDLTIKKHYIYQTDRYSAFLMAKTQNYGIKFPITIESRDNTLVDLNRTKRDLIKSELMHVIFTPQGQRLRNPMFGSNLIRFIFNPNEATTWGDVQSEIKELARKYVPDCQIQKISVNETESGMGLMCTINYTVANGDGSYSEDVITATI